MVMAMHTDALPAGFHFPAGETYLGCTYCRFQSTAWMVEEEGWLYPTISPRRLMASAPLWPTVSSGSNAIVPFSETQGSSVSLGSSARTSCSQPTMMPLGLMSCTCVVG